MPTYHTELQGLLNTGVVKIVCVWGDMGSKGLFRRRLEAARRWGGLGIRLILNVAQTNGRIRFDVYAPECWAQQLYEV